MKRTLLAFGMILALGAAACSRDSTSSPLSLSGNWTGTSNAGFALRLALSENSHGTVTGTATFLFASDSLGVLVTGTCTAPSVNLDLYSQGFETATLVGTLVGSNEMAGKLYGSGFGGDSLTFNRS